MKKSLIAMCLLAIMFSGCAKKPPVQEEVVVDPADRALAKAAAEIQRDLRMLAESNYDGPLPAESQSLAGMANYRFTGEIEDIVRDVGRNIGYNVDFNGRTPPQAIIVAIHSAEPMSWFNILQSAGVQAGDRANITVNDATRTITLSYDGIDMNAPARPKNPLPARTQVVRNNQSALPKTKAERQALAAQSRPVAAYSQTPADAASQPRTVQASSLMIGKPEYAQGNPAQYQGANTGVQQAINQPVAQGAAFRYSGGILGAQRELAKRLGYEMRAEGPISDMPVNINSASGNWQEVANSVNQQLRDASIFVDPANRLVVLRFWR